MSKQRLLNIKKNVDRFSNSLINLRKNIIKTEDDLIQYGQENEYEFYNIGKTDKLE